jgi:hypothetical protein
MRGAETGGAGAAAPLPSAPGSNALLQVQQQAAVAMGGLHGVVQQVRAPRPKPQTPNPSPAAMRIRSNSLHSCALSPLPPRSRPLFSLIPFCSADGARENAGARPTSTQHRSRASVAVINTASFRFCLIS